MDDLHYQRIVNEVETSTTEWESLREVVDAVVRHRARGEDRAAERILATDLPRRLALMTSLSSEAVCRTRLEDLFREAYRLSAIRQAVGDVVASTASSRHEPVSGRPQMAGQTESPSPIRPRRAFREPEGDDIASMIDDMLSASRS